MKEHMGIEHDISEIMCNYCSETFICSEDIIKHVESTHKEQDNMLSKVATGTDAEHSVAIENIFL